MINCPLEVFESLSIQLKELHKIFFTPSHLLVCINNLILGALAVALSSVSLPLSFFLVIIFRHVMMLLHKFWESLCLSTGLI